MTQSVVSCLHINHYNEGSRVPPVYQKPKPSKSKTSKSKSHKHHGLSGGAIAGIVVGTLAGAAIIAGVAFWLWRRKRRNQRKPSEADGHQLQELGASAHAKVSQTPADEATEMSTVDTQRTELPGSEPAELHGDFQPAEIPVSEPTEEKKK